MHLKVPAVPTLCCLAALAGTLFAYGAPPAFEAADVHPSPERLHPAIHGKIRGERIFLRDATLIDLISDAYEVESSDVVGGPPWIDYDRFDINAKAPPKTSDEDASKMMRTLLQDRFNLIAHTDKRPLPAFVLTAAKVNKLRKSAPAAEPGNCKYQPPAAGATPAPPVPGAPMQQPPIKFSCQNQTMEQFADFLHNAGSPYLNRPVVDQTGLKGEYDFDIEWTYRKLNDNSGVSIFDAVQKQLGLKLESKPVPTPVVVIESVNEKPTPNAAGLDKILPAPPAAQFDVAVIRPANPAERNFGVDIQGRRVIVRFATLQTLVYWSYDMPPGRIENKPKWLDDVHWDVTGTVSGDADAGPVPPIPGAPDLDVEDVKEMTRSLLADRFKLVTHTGMRDSTVYALTADNPKMKKTNDAAHTACIEGPGPDGKDPRLDNPLLNRLISCQNVTMAQFAIELHNLASGYVPAPVIDSTGLTGAYDFSLSFSKKINLNSPSASPSLTAVDTSGAPDPGVGGISLFDALQKQLGLKLQKKDKVPMSTLVIDHIEQQPTDN